MAKAKLATVSDKYENAHEVIKGDPRVDGPYLDDIRASQEEEYRDRRTKEHNAAVKAAKAAAKKEKASESKETKTPTEKAVTKKATAK